MKAENTNTVNDASKEKTTAVKTAVKFAKSVERKHHSHQKVLLKKKLEDKFVEQQCKVATLTKQIIHAERSSHNSLKKAATQQSQSKYIVKDMENTLAENIVLQERLIDLEATVDENNKKLQQMEAAVPITIIKKVREGNCGRPRWPLNIYELIMEQLVSGTPPTSVNGNIIAHVKAFSPSTIIKELPSIWTIRRTRTILLIVVQTLAAYRLGNSKKWRQLFTDGTSRRQVAYTNLAISCEEQTEEGMMLTPLLLTSSIYATDETAETVALAIENTVKEKGELLDKWSDMHSTLFGEDEEHSIPPLIA